MFLEVLIKVAVLIEEYIYLMNQFCFLLTIPMISKLENLRLNLSS